MKFFISHILIVSAIFFFGAESVAASPDISVSFEQTPLFQNANFAPGQEVVRSFTVTNNSTVVKNVIAEAINTTSCTAVNCFAKKLSVKIGSGSTVYYERKLSDLFLGTEVSLGAIEPAETRTFTITIAFVAGADDNNFQGSATNFDLMVGFQGEMVPAPPVNTVASSGSVSPAIFGLQINNEAASISSNESANGAGLPEGTVIVSWDTSYAAYGHVVFGPDDGTPYSLDLSKNNFGYPQSVPSDPFIFGHVDSPGKVQHHSFVLTGLIPGQTYRYRTVSHASPPTVGYEHTFTVPRAQAASVAAMAVGGVVVPAGGSVIKPGKESVLFGRSEATRPKASADEKNPHGSSNFAAANLAGVFPFGAITISAFVAWVFLRKKEGRACKK